MDHASRIAVLSPAERARLERELAARARAQPAAATRHSGGRAPLSPGQRRLWVLAQLDPGSIAYHRLLALRLDGPLDPPRLAVALRQVVERHEALRTRYDSVDGEPYQETGPVPDVELPVVHRPEPAGEARDTAVAAEVAELMEAPFDLSGGCLVRARLLRFAADEHLLLLCLHHLASDGWSDAILAGDLLVLYAGEEAALPPVAAGPADHAVRQREAVRRDGRAVDEFWREYLHPPLPTVELVGVGRPAPAGGRGRLLTTAPAADLIARADAVARSVGVTPFAVWLACYLVALRDTVLRPGPAGEVVVSVPSAGRPDADLHDAVGFFVNTLLLRVPLDGGAGVEELARRVHERLLAVLPYEDTPVERVLDLLPPDQRGNVAALVPIGFAYQNTPPVRLSRGGLRARVERLDPGTAKTALTLYVWPDEGAATVGLEYATDLVDAATAAEILRRTVEAGAGAGPPGDELERLYARGNLTRGQLLIWLSQELRPQSPIYNIAVVHEFRADIDPDRFAAALAEVIADSDALRTRIVVDHGVPRQVVDERPAGRHAYLDLGHHPPARAEALAREHFAELAARPLWPTGRLHDSVLARIGPGHHLWYWCAHHIAFDGWSVYVMFHRMQERLGAPGRPRPAAPSFADVVAAERARTAAGQDRAAQRFWAGRLAERAASGAAAPPVAADRPAHVYDIRLGPRRTARLREVAGSGAATEVGVYQALLVAVAVWWCRTRGRREVYVGMPMHNRRTAALRQVVGLLMGIYPLRLRVDPGATFAALVAAARAEVAEVVRHRDVTVRDPAGGRGFDVLLNYQAVRERTFLDRPYRVRWLHTGIADEALAVQVHDFDRRGDLTLSVQFRDDVAGPVEREAAGAQLVAVLDALLTDPGQGVHGVDLLPPQQRIRLTRLNDTTVAAGRLQPVPEVIAAAARRHPDRIAVVSGDERLSYGELDARAGALAARLRALGVGPEQRVCVYLDGGAETVIAVLAVLKAAAAYVPVDAAYGPGRLPAVFADAAPAAMVSRPDLLPSGWAAGVPVLDAMATPLPSTRDSLPAVDPDSLAYIAYTSGSTGRPKGCMVTHANLANAWLGWRTGFGLDNPSGTDVHLQLASLSFDVFTGNLVRALCSGATLVMCPQATRLDPPELLRLVERERVTHAEFVPAVLRGLVAHLAATGSRMDTWRLLIVGSDVWTADDQRALAACCAPGTRFLNSYGITETTIDSTYHLLGELAGGAAPIGRPMANTRVHILDDDLCEVLPGTVGELYLAGRGVGRGYHGRPAATAAVFLPDPFPAEPGARLYRTGDLARLGAGGDLEYLGRIDTQVKLRGIRLEPGELEHHLRRHPAVRDAAVVVHTGAGGPELLAYVVHNGRAPYSADLRRALADALPGAPLPARYLAVAAIPLTASGKPDRGALPDPDACEALPVRPYTSPRTETERWIADIWAAVLGRERVGVDENFFDVGGHSLLLIRVRDQLAARLGREVAVATLFQYPTVAGLAAHLSGTAPAPAPVPTPDRSPLLRQRARREASR
jgi:amino acid adenylation domain-containing protein